MAITTQGRLGKATHLLRHGLASFVQREDKELHLAQATDEALRYLGEHRTVANKAVTDWDAAVSFRVMCESWNDVFSLSLGSAERSIVQEVRDCR
jgi:hypothetical protein